MFVCECFLFPLFSWLSFLLHNLFSGIYDGRHVFLLIVLCVCCFCYVVGQMKKDMQALAHAQFGEANKKHHIVKVLLTLSGAAPHQRQNHACHGDVVRVRLTRVLAVRDGIHLKEYSSWKLRPWDIH